MAHPLLKTKLKNKCFYGQLIHFLFTLRRRCFIYLFDFFLRYETRQRKCPKCNAAFGATDYHRWELFLLFLSADPRKIKKGQKMYYFVQLFRVKEPYFWLSWMYTKIIFLVLAIFLWPDIIFFQTVFVLRRFSAECNILLTSLFIRVVPFIYMDKNVFSPK